ncbi:sulfurtransferase TusA family protein [Colwellia sp. RSH04]|nr:sulfurtransferase TusA family protein [Colwellia sp. RSH04]
MIHKYDGTQEKCPVPLVNMRLILKKMAVDDQCVIRINDLASVSDIPKFLIKQGYCYSQQTIANGIIEITIENKKIDSRD